MFATGGFRAVTDSEVGRLKEEIRELKIAASCLREFITHNPVTSLPDAVDVVEYVTEADRGLYWWCFEWEQWRLTETGKKIKRIRNSDD